MIRPCVAGAVLLSIASGAVGAQSNDLTRWDASRDALTFRLSARTPSQMAAFYEGRGVVRRAIDQIRAACFLGGVIVNRTPDVLWIDLEQWRFLDRAGQSIRRYKREYWTDVWKRLDVPLANRSVFNWTQLPEQRDLRPAESVGGNLSLVPPKGSFVLEAHFPQGAARDKGEMVVRVENLHCPRDSE